MYKKKAHLSQNKSGAFGRNEKWSAPAHNGLFRRIARDNALNENAHKKMSVFAHWRNLRIPPLCRRNMLERHRKNLYIKRTRITYVYRVFSKKDCTIYCGMRRWSAARENFPTRAECMSGICGRGNRINGKSRILKYGEKPRLRPQNWKYHPPTQRAVVPFVRDRKVLDWVCFCDFDVVCDIIF